MTDKAACPVLSAERMRKLADRLMIEYHHLHKYPGSIVRGSPDISKEEWRDVRARYKVVAATHTDLLLADLAGELRYWANQADQAVQDNTDCSTTEREVT